MKIKLVLFALVGFIILDGCDIKVEDISTKESNLTLDITGLEDLGSGYRYEGWTVDNDDTATSTGVFTVNSEGELSQTSFKVNKARLDSGIGFVITIEPNPDNNPRPSSTRILGGSFILQSAFLSTDHPVALGTDFSTAEGSYILFTPSDDGGMGRGINELSGLWFGNLPAGGRGVELTPSLTLPALPPGEGWKYEGWVIVNAGVSPLSTGTFTSGDIGDEADAFFTRGAMPVPSVPGEDFLANAPDGVTFPIDLSEARVVISVEPNPDNSPAPFFFKPLSDNIISRATTRESYNLTTVGATRPPFGTAERGS